MVTVKIITANKLIGTLRSEFAQNKVVPAVIDLRDIPALSSYNLTLGGNRLESIKQHLRSHT